MALVGQIVTVSDVLMDGTVNNYIMGADANVFQTNYNSSGVMTNWSIGNISKVGIYGTNSATNSLILNVPTYQIQMDDSSMFIGPRTGSNYIYYSGNSRPYFGTCASNYIVGNNDLQYGLGHHNHDYLQGNGLYSHLSLSFGDVSLGHYISFKDVVNNHTFNPGYFSHNHSSIQGWNDVGSQGTTVHTTSTEGYLQYTDGSNNNMFYVSSLGSAVYGAAFFLNTPNILTSNNCSYISLHTTNGVGIGIGAREEIQITGPAHAYSLRYAPTEGAQNIMLNALNEVILTGGSSRRLKKDITDLIDKKFNPELLYKLPLKQFKYKEDPQNRDIIGFIAEEVEEFYPGASIYHYDKSHKKIIDDWEVRYIVPPMLKLIQDQHQEIETLKTEIAEIKELLKNK